MWLIEFRAQIRRICYSQTAKGNNNTELFLYQFSSTLGLTEVHICQAQEKLAGLAFDFPLQTFTMVTIVSVKISQQMQLLQ